MCDESWKKKKWQTFVAKKLFFCNHAWQKAFALTKLLKKKALVVAELLKKAFAVTKLLKKKHWLWRNCCKKHVETIERSFCCDDTSEKKLLLLESRKQNKKKRLGWDDTVDKEILMRRKYWKEAFVNKLKMFLLLQRYEKKIEIVYKKSFCLKKKLLFKKSFCLKKNFCCDEALVRSF